MSREFLQNIIEDFNPEKFVRFFREKNRSFAPKKEELIQYDDNNLRNGVKLGEIDFSGSEQMTICAFETVHALSERSGKKAQYKEGKKILKERQCDAGIFIFYDQKGNFRFSLIYANYLGSRRDWSAFRRFTYFVSKELTNKTFLRRIGDGDFSSLDKIKEAFSVKKVTEEFYTDIAYWYFWAVQHVKFPADAEKEENGRNIAVIRMITRLIFIWFMKERGLISQSLFNQSNISTLLNDLSSQKTTYYKAILQNLFFATLNTKIKDRKFRFSKSFQGRNKNYMDHGIYRYEDYFKNREDMLEVFRDIPFLNGGLFDCLDRRETQNEKNVEIRMDGFTDKEVGLNVPNFLFFSDETNADLNKEYGTINKKYKVSGLIDILSSYNFTIDENDPNDQEVALDPELLGKVFENLLASFNPETASTARKATGSYYTPREIVDYMVTQSLKEYFKTHLKETDEPLNSPTLTGAGKSEKMSPSGGGEGEDKMVFLDEIDSKLDLLFTHDSEINPFNKSDTSRMVNLIDNLRIVDPAVGSGAFPMGILNKLVFILSKLDPDNTLWKETQIKAVEKSVPDPIVKQKLKEQIEEQFTEKNLDYGRKLYLIQKCIYGVDIQQTAVEIAKLRFFISLLVDEKIEKAKENWGIEPLPNLDFKIMQGNSLISEFMGIDLDDDNKDKGQRSFFSDGMDELINQFKQKKNEYQSEPDRDKKELLKHAVDNLIIAMFETKLKKQKSDYFSQLQAIEKKYLVIPNEKERNEIIAKEKDAVYKKTGFNLEAIERQLIEFTDGLKVKPFFAWKLYFAEVFQEKGGFDIVIANPPYLKERDNKKVFEIVNKSNFGKQYHQGKMDFWYYFLHKAIDIVKKEGTISYITSRYWLNSSGAKKLIKRIKEEISFIDFVDIGKLKVFDQVAGQHMVAVYQKSKEKLKLIYKIIVNDLSDISKNEDTENIKISILSNKDIFSDNGEIILEKYSLNTSDIVELGIVTDISQGVVEAPDKLSVKQIKNAKKSSYTAGQGVFVLTKKEVEYLNLNKNELLILKKYLDPSNVNKYLIQFTNKYLIYSDNQIKEEIKKNSNYSRIKNHLDHYKYFITSSNKPYGLHRPRDRKYFDSPKIIFKNMFENVGFAYDEKDNYYFGFSFSSIIQKDKKYDLKYILAILDSKFAEYWFYKNGKKRGVGVDIGVGKLRLFPIKNILPTEQQPFISIVDQVLAAKQKDTHADTSALEKQIDPVRCLLSNGVDQMVYKLYDLTPEEIAIVEGKEQ